ncbi:MAG TPA: hypothetical protein VGF94_08380 [Kofleriaceae bacterium]|jgi:hypothetical protein
MLGATRIPAPVGLVVVAALALVATPRPTTLPPASAARPVTVVGETTLWSDDVIVPPQVDPHIAIAPPWTGDRMNLWRPPLWDFLEPLLQAVTAL